MAVAHSPAGFTGTVDQVDEARRFAVGGGGRFRVNGSGDWALTAHATVNRTVNIAAGMAAACGVLDLTTAADSVTFTANAGGSDRLDVVVASFDWAAMTITFRVIQGTTVLPTIVKTGTTVDTTKINWLPGTRYDAVLGVIRVRPGVTILAPADLYDCRPWGTWSGLSVITTFSGAAVIDVDPYTRIRETSSGRAWEWTGTAFRLTPTELHFVSNGPGSGYSTIGNVGQSLIVSGPSAAHAPGTVRIRVQGVWTADSTSAGLLWLAWGPNSSNPAQAIAVASSYTRIFNYGSTAPISFVLDGYFDSDGTPKYFWVFGSTDATSSWGYTVRHSTWQAWLI